MRHHSHKIIATMVMAILLTSFALQIGSARSLNMPSTTLAYNMAIAPTEPMVNTIALFNTGVDNQGNLLVGGTVDPHYTVIQNPDRTFSSSSAFVTTRTPGSWVPNGPNSKWIAPSPDQISDPCCAAAATYVYRTTFDLTRIDPSTVVINGQWTTDNNGVDILINGQGTGFIIPSEGFGTLNHLFTINSGFSSGVNTLDFVVFNGGSGMSSTGLRVEILSATGMSSGCQVNVDGLKMSDAHTLQVDLTGEFSQNLSSQKSLSVGVVVNGKMLTNQFIIPSGLAGTQPHPFFFDLNANQVPRFADNAQIPITATLTENGDSCTNTATGIVLLPVIVVPGILNGRGGDHTFADLENFMTNPFNFVGLFGDKIGQPYQLRTAPLSDTCTTGGLEEYPTLYTLSYNTSRASFFDGARALESCVQDVRNLTWADKVNIVTHSKGGLVARQYVVEQNSPPVSRLIMAQPPNLGALKATWEELLGKQFLPFQNLLPVWAWQRNKPNNDFRIPSGEENRELEYLNSFPLPRGVTYTIIHSTSVVNTQMSRTGTNPLTFQFTLTAGDGIVPWFSQQGYMVRLDQNGNIDPNSVPTPIPAFIGSGINYINISGGHRGYLDSQDVKPAIVSQLLKTN